MKVIDIRLGKQENGEYRFAIRIKGNKNISLNKAELIAKKFMGFYNITNTLTIRTKNSIYYIYETNGLVESKAFENLGIEIIGNGRILIKKRDIITITPIQALEYFN